MGWEDLQAWPEPVGLELNREANLGSVTRPRRISASSVIASDENFRLP